MPQGQIVPEQCHVSVVMSFISHSKQAVIVQVPRQECLSWHIDDVVFHVELEVGLLVEGGVAFLWLALIDDLNRVFARFEVDPDCLRRFVLIELENSLVAFVVVIVFVTGVSLNFLILQQVVPLC